MTGDLDHTNTELLDLSTLKWKVSRAYPFGRYFHSGATLAVDRFQAIYVFGGVTDFVEQDNILMFSLANFEWTNAGRLSSPRSGHSVIKVGKVKYVFGGFRNHTAEICSSTKGTLECQLYPKIELTDIIRPSLFLFNKQKCKLIKTSMLVLHSAFLNSVSQIRTYNPNVKTDHRGMLLSSRDAAIYYKNCLNEKCQESDRNDVFDHKIYDDVQLHQACPVTFRGHFYFFGGINGAVEGFIDDLHGTKPIVNHKQIAKLADCKVHNIGTLPFSFFESKACTTGLNKLYLCFSESDSDEDDGKTCFVADHVTGPFEKVKQSPHYHFGTQIATSHSKSIKSPFCITGKSLFELHFLFSNFDSN